MKSMASHFRIARPVYLLVSAVFVSMFVVSFACSAAWASEDAEGNSHGGGGFTAQDEPVGVPAITQAIRDARMPVAAWFHSLDREYFSYLLTTIPGANMYPQYWTLRLVNRDQFDAPAVVDRFLPGSEHNVFSSIDHLHIEVRKTRPCTNGEKDVDGAFNPSRPSAICISAFRLARKLTKSNYQVQVQALIIHELTHLFGGNEIEAVNVQSAALRDLTLASFAPIDGKFTDYKTTIVPEFIEMISWMITSESLTEANHLAQALAVQMRALTNSLQTAGGSMFLIDAHLFDRLSQFMVLSRALSKYACSQDTHEPVAKREACRKNYLDGFNGSTEVSIDEYQGHNVAAGDGYMDTVMIKKIETPDDWKTQLGSIQMLLGQVADATDLASKMTFPLNEMQ